MDWTTVDFTGVTDQVVAILPVVIPVGLGIFAIGLALRYAKKVLRMFA